MTSSTEQLRTAIDTGDLASVKRLIASEPALLQAIVRPARQNRNYRPLTEAAVECQLEILAFLVASGCDVTEDHNYPMFRASLYDRCVPALEFLVGHGADVNGVWDDYGPPLIASCEGRSCEAMKWLLAHGATIIGNARGRTKDVAWNAVTHAAFSKDRPELLELLIGHGADVNAPDRKGMTGLHVAAKTGFVKGVEILLGGGADTTLKDNAGRTALAIARNEKIVTLLANAT
ncbi:MAG: ankyrin repeat domain-containing protein [Acidobacteriota bacterium]